MKKKDLCKKSTVDNVSLPRPKDVKEARQSSSSRACISLDNVRCLFGDSDDRGGGVAAELVRKNRRIDDAEALDAEHA
jgi:hypothetical protein